MTLTLLIDLDDTLLGNKMESFIPAYMKALGKQFAAHAESGDFGSVMMAATEKMFRNNLPDRSLKETFDSAFYPSLGITEDQVRESIDYFYEHIFPSLKSVTQVRPDAVRLVETAIQRGWQVAVATNPLFPLVAITQRLGWAGVPVEKYPFELVPSYESFHFAKPNPAFFAELLGRFGWPRGPVLMIGNDPSNDVNAAQLMGIPTFWISNGQPYPGELLSPSASGALKDVVPWLESISMEELSPDYKSPSAIIGTMRGVPSALLAMTSDLSAESWGKRPAKDEWSLTEIACHLRDVETEINLPRLNKIITEDNPFIPGVDSDAWAVERDYHAQDGQHALREFVASRKQTLAQLESLTAEDWQRSVQHTIFGPTDLREIFSIAAGHDRLHSRQAHCIIETLDLRENSAV